MKGTGEFVWYDVWTRDLEEARRFYTQVIGWGTQAFGEGPGAYTMWTVGDRAIGGIGPVPPEQDGSPGPPHWAAFVAVDNVDATAQRAKELGGGVRTPGTDIPGVGRFAVIQDPQGAVLALLSSQQEHDPADRSKAGMVCWHELHATDQDSAWRFYSELFGWKQGQSYDMGEAGTYLTFRLADAPEDRTTGGMFNGAKASNGPARWLYYFNVPDLEAAMERVRAAGGKVHEGPMDVPGGRIAPCEDTQGAAFALFSLAK